MKKTIVNFIAFGCLGLATEVFFTAFSDLAASLGNESIDWSLTGKSYVWMFFIYGSAALFFPPLWKQLSKFNLGIRLLIYVVGIFVVEFISGWILLKVTGACPWEYKTGWHVMGLIRFDYAPFWAGFGLILETVYKWLESAGAANDLK